MSAPTAPNCVAELLERLETCDALDRDRFHQFLEQQPPSSDDPLELLNRLVAAGVLTAYHKKNILLGRFQGYCLGPYRMLDHLGTGGMGKVYLAEHLELQRRVAIKVLPKKMIDEPGSRERFSREARAAAALDHPNLVRVYDVETSGRIPFIVMEYIEGESLAERVIRLGPLPVSDLVNYAIQTASGLQHAHERGLIHRDIKPANLLLDRHGVLKILDMGLARFNDERADQLTAKLDPDSVLGTPDYLSPEQAINSNTVDIRSDLYSLGATLYHLASGRVPFRGSTAQKLMQVQLRNPDPFEKIRPDMPPRLAKVLNSLLAKDPNRRPKTPQAALDALLPFLPPETDMPHAGSRVSMKRPALPSRRLKALPIMLAGVTGVAIASGLTWMFWPAKPITAPPDQRNSLVNGPLTVEPREQQASLVAVGTLTSVRPVLTNLQFTADGKTVWAGTGNNQQKALQSWNVTTGQSASHFALEFEPRALALSADDAYLAASGSAGEVQLLDTATGQPIRNYAGATKEVRTLAFSPDGKLLAGAGDDQIVFLWERATGRELGKLIGHTNFIFTVGFSPDGQYLLSGANLRAGQSTQDHGPFRAWKLPEQAEEPQIAWPRAVKKLSFAASSESAALASLSGLFGLYNPRTRHLSTRGKLPPGYVNDLALLPDGKQVLIAMTRSPQGEGESGLLLYDIEKTVDVQMVKGATVLGVARVAVNAAGTMAVSSARSATALQVWKINK